MAAIIQIGGFSKEKAGLDMLGGYVGCLPVFVRFTKGEDNVLELSHDIFGGMVHEVESMLVVRF